MSTSVQTNLVLRPHQQSALEWIANREATNLPYGLLSMLMGLGKTATMLQHIYNTKAKATSPTLVVVPKTAIFTWRTEITKFFGGSLKLYVFRNDENNLDNITSADLAHYDIVLTNFEFVRHLGSSLNRFSHLETVQIAGHDNEGWPVTHIGANISTNPVVNTPAGPLLLFSTNWYRIVADESHNFSNLKTSLWKAMMCLCGRNRWCLTGTPIRNACSDLYSQFKWLGYHDEFYSASAFVKQDMSDFIRYVTYESANISLPPVQHHRVLVELTAEQKQIYNYYLNEARSAFSQWAGGDVSFDYVFVMFLRLRQVCIAPFSIGTTDSSDYNTALVTFQHNPNLHHLSSWIQNQQGTAGLEAAKINKAAEIVSNIASTDKIVIFTMFVGVIELLQQKLSSFRKTVVLHGGVTGTDRDNAIQMFKQNSDINVLIVGYKVGSESLNLTEANHVILMEPWWCPAVIEQAKARIHRMGQNMNCSIYELAAQIVDKGQEVSTIETKMLEVCKKKTDEANHYLQNSHLTPSATGLNANMMHHLLF